MPYRWKPAALVMEYHGVRVFRAYLHDDYTIPHPLRYQWHDGHGTSGTMDIRVLCDALPASFATVTDHRIVLRRWIDRFLTETSTTADTPPWVNQPGQLGHPETLETYADDHLYHPYQTGVAA